MKIASVDTMVTHLAGALARPVWTLLSTPPDWRWMLDTCQSPWYPTMRLLRQTQDIITKFNLVLTNGRDSTSLEPGEAV